MCISDCIILEKREEEEKKEGKITCRDSCFYKGAVAFRLVQFLLYLYLYKLLHNSPYPCTMVFPIPAHSGVPYHSFHVLSTNVILCEGLQ